MTLILVARCSLLVAVFQTPDLLRVFLFCGLLLHKLIWEIGRIRFSASASRVTYPLLSVKRILKSAKVLLLLFFFIQALFLNVLPMKDSPEYLRLGGVVIFSIGLAMSITGRWNLGTNWANVEDGQILPHQKLVTTGIYSLVRHPIYAGDVLLVLGMQFALQSWLFLLALFLLVVITRQAMAEEKMLAAAFPGYVEYQSRTKRFLPFIF